MAICRFNVDKFTHNIESNLELMGLPVPKTVFGSMATMSGALASIEAALMTKAADVSISVIASRAAGTTVAGVTASFLCWRDYWFSIESVNKCDVMQWRRA